MKKQSNDEISTGTGKGIQKTANEASQQNNNSSEEGNYAGVEGVAAGSLNKDANDEKVMATSPNDKPGREVIASLATLNDNRNSPIINYYEFPTSKTDQYDTYPERMSKISDALGNKDSVKG